MGLTIHYSIAVPKRWPNETIRAKLEALRQFCMDLPVVEVSELHEFKGKDCEPGEKDENDPCRWAKIQAARSLESPWEPGTHFHQPPSHMLVFSVRPAKGAEEMNIGVCSFRPFVCPSRKPKKKWGTYTEMLWDKPAWSLAIERPESYPAAARVLKAFAKRWRLRRRPPSKDYARTHEHIARGDFYRVCVCRGRYQSHRRGYAPSWVLVEIEDRMSDAIQWRFHGTLEDAKRLLKSHDFKADLNRLLWGEEHTIPAETSTWGSFCKTQYANDSRVGGMRNFLRAHLSVCAILEKAQDLGFRVHVSDEGEFWDKRDVKALAEEVGQWDQMIAAQFGVLKDSDPRWASPMQGRPDFEQLEAKAQTTEIGKLVGKIRDFLPKMEDESR